MSADDQRAAEPVDFASAEAVFRAAAQTHRGGAHAAMLAEVDRLRAELAETRAAGDALAFAVAPIERMGRGAPGSRLDVLITRAEEWRSVRGDAPTAGGLLPDKRIRINLTPPSRAIPAAERRNLAAELRSRFVDGPVDEWSAGWLSAAGYIGSDSPIGVDPGTDLTASTVEPAEPSAVGLPVTLSSVDDVAVEDAALGDNRQVRSELAELRDHLSLPDSATAADVVARAKLVAEWPSCFDLISEGSRWEIVHRAAPEQAGPPPPLCDLPCEGCGTAEVPR